MKKAEIRRLYLEKKASLSDSEIYARSEQIFKNFISHFSLQENQKIHCFLSIPEKGEVDTSLFLDFLFENNIRVFVPKIVNGKMISQEIMKETPLVKSQWGIEEPIGDEDCGVKDYDFIITPLLYCDGKGNRVGYGKGFYDQFFETIHPDCLKIGVGLFEPSTQIDDVWEKDIPLNYLVTPIEVLSFSVLPSKSTK